MSDPVDPSVNAIVYIGAASPMFQYAPTRNGPLGSSWLQGNGGTSCGGPATFAVQIDDLVCKCYFRSPPPPQKQAKQA